MHSRECIPKIEDPNAASIVKKNIVYVTLLFDRWKMNKLSGKKKKKEQACRGFCLKYIWSGLTIVYTWILVCKCEVNKMLSL